VLQNDWRSLLHSLKGLVLDLVDGNDFRDFLHAWDDLRLGLVVLMDHRLVNLHNVEIVLVHVVLVNVVLVEVLLVDGVNVDIVLVEMVPEDDLLLLVVLVNLVLMMVEMLDFLFMSVVMMDLVDVLVGFNHFGWFFPSPSSIVNDRSFPTPAWWCSPAFAEQEGVLQISITYNMYSLAMPPILFNL